MKNTDKFKEYIRSLVRAEVKSVIAEAFSGGAGSSAPRPAAQPATKNNKQFFAELANASQVAIPAPQQKTAPKKWNTKNSAINEILAETQATGRTITERGFPVYTELDYGLPPREEVFVPTRHDLKIETPAPPVAPVLPVLNEETQLQAKLGIYTDYSEKLKLIAAKSKNRGFGGGSALGLSVPSGIPTDFSTID